MDDRKPKPYSEIQDRNLTKNPELRDKGADNASYTPSTASGQMEEPSSRSANSIESITPTSDNRNAGGMMGEG